jgi:hypothetical protein
VLRTEGIRDPRSEVGKLMECRQLIRSYAQMKNHIIGGKARLPMGPISDLLV